MLRQLTFGGLVSVANIVVHAIVMTAVVTTARRAGARTVGHSQAWLASVMVATTGILLLAHAAEVAIWALAYAVLGVAPPEADVLYFAFVNYTTLGYGDVVPQQRWRLLGPTTAMTGILMFGWSTAVIFEVLRSAMRIRDAGGRGRVDHTDHLGPTS